MKLQILSLRILVGYLGERQRCGWWPTMFFDEASRLFLDPVFPATTRLAQYHGIIEAARRLHDEHLSVGNYHLFRLPEEVEQDLYRMVQAVDCTRIIHSLTASKEIALAELTGMAGAISEDRIGPVSVAGIDALEDNRTVRSMAAIYLSAFRKGARSYPYLVASL